MVELAIITSQDVEIPAWLDDPHEIRLPARDTSVRAVLGHAYGRELLVLPRNGSGRPIPAHALDYRANIEALVRAGARKVLCTAMVGSLRTTLPPGSMVILDQFIDFTRDRQSTYFPDDRFGHADMTDPYCPTLRGQLIRSAAAVDIAVAPRGCYVCWSGPRFETRAEAGMFAHLGGDVIGQTSSTECVMAREAGLCLAAFAGVLNMSSGLSHHDLRAGDWHDIRKSHAAHFMRIVEHLVREWIFDDPASSRSCLCNDGTPIEA